MKKLPLLFRTFTLPGILSALILFGAILDAQGARRVRVRLATIAPKGTSYHQSLMELREEWRDLSGGAVDMTIYPGGIQGSEDAMVDRMRINRTQAGLLTAVGLSKIVPEVTGLQSIPMLFNSLEEVEYIGERMRPRLERMLLDKGFVVLFWSDAGWVRFFSKSPVTYPDDLRKLKLFTWAGDAPAADILRKAGMNPVPLDTSDIVPSLHTGLIEAVPMPPFAANAGQVYNAAPHMLDLNWAPLVGACVINKDTWNDIPPELKPKLLAAAKKTGEAITKTGRAEQKEAVEVMQSRWNLKVQPVNDEIRDIWRRETEKVYSDIRGKVVPVDIFDEVIALLKEYRAKNQ